jgi:O-methyltransferase involved in polyketide biosynthesis
MEGLRPRGVDTKTPNVARMYDYFLGGKDNFAADRAAAKKILRVFPDTPVAAQANRDFMRRAVRHLADAGIDQFLDIGSGLPTRGNVHEVAQCGARVTYVDYDPMVLSHANALLAGAPNVTVIQADLRRPREILGHPDLGLDLSRPIALLVVAILHFVPDEDRPYDILAEYRDAMAPGSHLALSHLTDEGVREELVRAGRAAYKGATAPIVPRSRARILRFFDGFDLVDPGLAWISEWRPDNPNVPKSHGFAGVGRLP